MNENVKISSPWISYYREVNALFGADPDVRVEYDNENIVMKLFVDDQDKADAIAHLLPQQKVFGNIVLDIRVIPANKSLTKTDYVERAFKGNPNFSRMVKTPIEITQTNPFNYALFRNFVAQYFNDNLHDPHGNVNTLLENIARDVIGEDEGVYFSTDTPDNVSMAVG